MTEPMGTDVQRLESMDWRPQEITVPTTGALQRLEAEAAALDKAYKMARALSATEMVPAHFQQHGVNTKTGQPNGEAAAWNLAAAIIYGSEIGLTAVQSAQNVFVVKGKPAVYARTMAAQVRRAGYKIEEVAADDEHVVWRAERDGKWVTSEWTIERAKQAQYTSNAKYQTNPQEMLRAKCIAEVCRIQYQDVLLGMAYSVEELMLDNVTVQRVVKREAGGAEKLRALAAESEKALAPPPQEQSAPAGVVAADPECLTPSRTERIELLRKLYKAKGMTGQVMHDDIAQILQLDQKLTTLNKLTPEDIEELLELLQKPEPELQ